GTLFQAMKHRSLVAFHDLARNGVYTAAQAAMNAVVVLYQAYLSVDAIVRTLARVGFRRQHMLEWETAASADRRLGAALTYFLKTMWPAMALSLALAGLVLLVRPDAVLTASGFLLAWFLSPVIAWWMSQDRAVREKPLSEAERRELGVIARKTWGFFESFVGA